MNTNQTYEQRFHTLKEQVIQKHICGQHVGIIAVFKFFLLQFSTWWMDEHAAVHRLLLLSVVFVNVSVLLALCVCATFLTCLTLLNPL